MSFFKPTAGGYLVPTASSIVSFTRQTINNGSNPAFNVTFGQSTFSWKTNSHDYYVRVYDSSNTYIGEAIADQKSIGQGNTNPASGAVTLTAGTTYYVKIQPIDRVYNVRGPESAASSSLKALTRPANVGTVTLTGGTNTLGATWSAPNGGGEALTYTYVVYNSSGTVYQGATTTSNTSFSLSSVPAGNYYATVFASNSAFSQQGAASQSSTVSVVAPPFFPFFPSFGPYFPFFPSFGPFFPFFPSFGGGGGGPKSLFSNTKVRTPNGLVFANQLQVGDELLSVVLPGLSEEGWTPQDVIDWSVNNPMFDFSNTVTTTVMDIIESTANKIIFINGDAFSGSHRILVKRDGIARMIAAEDMIETDMIWSATDNLWVTIAIEVVESPHQVYSINCEPYDVFFTEHMLVHDTRPDI